MSVTAAEVEVGEEDVCGVFVSDTMDEVVRKDIDPSEAEAEGDGINDAVRFSGEGAEKNE